jgi:hypothetical protein
MPDVEEKMPGVSPMQMADIILQYKKETQAADYQQWVVAITAFKKIMIAKTIRELTNEEKRILSVVEEQIKIEMQNISLTVPATQATPATPAQPAAGQPATPAAQPISSSIISPRLQNVGSVITGLAASGAIATVGVNEIIRSVGTLSLPDLSTLASLVGVAANASTQVIVNTITSMPITSLSTIAATLAAGGTIRYYRNPATPVAQGVPQQPVVAVNPAVGVQIPIDIPANDPNDPNQGVGDPAPGINNNPIGNIPANNPNSPWLFNPAGNPNNPWLTPIQGVGDPIPGINNPLPGLVLDRVTAYSKWVRSQRYNRQDGYYMKVPKLRRMVIDFGITSKTDANKMNRAILLDVIDNWVTAGGDKQNDFLDVLYETMS